MTIVAPPVDPVAAARYRAALPLRRMVLDIHLLAKRNLMKVMRKPRFIIFSTLQPIMQLILFVFVFGSIAQLQGLGLSYKDFVVPAVIIQTMTFTGVQSGIGIADDMNTGMIDRFRSLPIARAAFLLGRTASDTARLTFQVLLLVATALVIGFRFQNGLVSGVGMVVIAIMFGMALVTFSEYVGLAVKDPETVQAAEVTLVTQAPGLTPTQLTRLAQRLHLALDPDGPQPQDTDEPDPGYFLDLRTRHDPTVHPAAEREIVLTIPADDAIGGDIASEPVAKSDAARRRDCATYGDGFGRAF
jgi:ABC-2 type transport system permease protein/oleandomycin transport system permease protein